MKNPLDRFTIRPVMRERVAAALDSLEVEFIIMKSTTTGGPWVGVVESTFEKAKATDPYLMDVRWNYIHLIEQNMVWGMNEHTRHIKAIALRAEVQKMAGSRVEAILGILGKGSEQTPTAEALHEALVIRDNYYDTKYHKINLRRASLHSLAVLLITIVIGGIGWIAFLSFYAQQQLPAQLPFWQEAISGLFLGTLGASFSMAYTLTASSLDVKIPDQIMGAMVTVIRIAIGGTAAFVALLIFRSGMLSNVLSDHLLRSPFGFLIISFIAGFSERWIVNVIQIISKEKEMAVKS